MVRHYLWANVLCRRDVLTNSWRTMRRRWYSIVSWMSFRVEKKWSKSKAAGQQIWFAYVRCSTQQLYATRSANVGALNSLKSLARSNECGSLLIGRVEVRLPPRVLLRTQALVVCRLNLYGICLFSAHLFGMNLFSMHSYGVHVYGMQLYSMHLYDMHL